MYFTCLLVLNFTNLFDGKVHKIKTFTYKKHYEWDVVYEDNIQSLFVKLKRMKIYKDNKLFDKTVQILEKYTFTIDT